MTISEKAEFLRHTFSSLLRPLDAHAKGSFGVLNGQQMVEHFIDAVNHASGKFTLPVVNEGERLDKARDFMYSEMPFKENTRNPLMPEDPAPAKLSSMDEAITKLQKAIDHFFSTFENDPAFSTINPFFGKLDFDGNVQLLYKHAIHHLRQFGLA